MSKETERATLGGGCFWCLEAIYQDVIGVEKVTSGYAGGAVENPTYEQVCSGRTGHAEVVQIEYDPQTISYDELLTIFWRIHDPTTLNRQGADVGTQYRSIILTHDDRQQAIAERSLADAQAQGLYRDPIVTEIEPLDTFYPAEAYHDDCHRPQGAQVPQIVRRQIEAAGLNPRPQLTLEENGPCPDDWDRLQPDAARPAAVVQRASSCSGDTSGARTSRPSNEAEAKSL